MNFLMNFQLATGSATIRRYAYNFCHSSQVFLCVCLVVPSADVYFTVYLERAKFFSSLHDIYRYCCLLFALQICRSYNLSEAPIFF